MKKVLIFLSILMLAGLLNAYEGVNKVWVSSSQWANSKSQVTFGQSAAQIEGATNNHQAALAVYFWALRVFGHGGGGHAEGGKGSEAELNDWWGNWSCYSRNYCVTWAHGLCELWMGYKNNFTMSTARKVNSPNHSQSSFIYQDADGVSRDHLFDGLTGVYLYYTGGTRIASPEEIASNYSLLNTPINNPKPYFIRVDDITALHSQSDWSYFTGGGSSYDFQGYNTYFNVSTYNTDFNLRKGESILRKWTNDHKPVLASAEQEAIYIDNNRATRLNPSGEVKDPRNYKAIRMYTMGGNTRSYGNAYHVFEPWLPNNKFAEGAVSSSGLTSEAPTATDPGLHPTAAGTEGNAIYEIYSIYPFAESQMEGSYFIKSAGTITLEFSINGGSSWTTLQTYNTVNAAVQNFSFEFAKTRWDAGQSTPYNISGYSGTTWIGYKYRVRVRINATTTAKDVGFATLRFKNTMMLNAFMLPALMPGDNAINVEGQSLTTGCAVRVTYSYSETGVVKTDIAYAQTLPYTYHINIAATDTLAVLCRSVEIAVIDVSQILAAKSSLPGSALEARLDVFPNPGTRGLGITLLTSDLNTERIFVYNQLGQQVRSLETTGNRTLWDGRNDQGAFLAPGNYVLRVNANGKQYVKSLTLLK